MLHNHVGLFLLLKFSKPFVYDVDLCTVKMLLLHAEINNNQVNKEHRELSLGEISLAKWPIPDMHTQFLISEPHCRTLHYVGYLLTSQYFCSMCLIQALHLFANIFNQTSSTRNRPVIFWLFLLWLILIAHIFLLFFWLTVCSCIMGYRLHNEAHVVCQLFPMQKWNNCQKCPHSLYMQALQLHFKSPSNHSYWHCRYPLQFVTL